MIVTHHNYENRKKNVYHLLLNTPLDLAGIGPWALDVYVKIAFLITALDVYAEIEFLILL